MQCLVYHATNPSNVQTFREPREGAVKLFSTLLGTFHNKGKWGNPLLQQIATLHLDGKTEDDNERLSEAYAQAQAGQDTWVTPDRSTTVGDVLVLQDPNEVLFGGRRYRPYVILGAGFAPLVRATEIPDNLSPVMHGMLERLARALCEAHYVLSTRDPDATNPEDVAAYVERDWPNFITAARTAGDRVKR